jgi:NADH:ubiquinone oxidoreductase subunit 5 (subunit L)/multisubunit Na+/H+ antiporter MnhA subunit
LVAPLLHSPVAAISSLLAVLVGFIGAFTFYARAAIDPLPEKLGVWGRAMRNRFYFDEIYAATVIPLHEALAGLAAWVDRWLIAGFLVRGTHGATEILGRGLRLVQTGNLQMYAFLFALGVAFLLFLVLR